MRKKELRFIKDSIFFPTPSCIPKCRYYGFDKPVSIWVNIFCKLHFKFKFLSWGDTWFRFLSSLRSTSFVLLQSHLCDWSITMFFSLAAAQSQIDVFRGAVLCRCLCELFSLCFYQITITWKHPNAEIAIQAGLEKEGVNLPNSNIIHLCCCIVMGAHNAVVYSS